MLESLHPVFREVDRAVVKYVELTHESPSRSDAELVSSMKRQGIEESLANDCITFVPLAFGRVVVDGVGMTAAAKVKLFAAPR